MTHNELRQTFLDFFEVRGHAIVPSSPLVPERDPSMLFTSAGMVQFKPLYSGTVPLPYTRAASVQKCLRLSDLENVGRRRRYNTFFEMLGNFSFGDYFKREAIEWAWEYLLQVVELSAEKLYISVYEEDDEAYRLWTDGMGIDPSRIVRLGKGDNFWGPAGSTGPCGPCSEIYYDFGQELGCGKPECAPGCDCDRYAEIWNLVFPQYDMDATGKLNPLAHRGIDTGMGLERLAAASQGKRSIFETDLVWPVIEEASSELNARYHENEHAYMVIADHARSLTFAIAEGVLPTNEGRGYVIRRLIRRGQRMVHNLGCSDPFLYRLVGTVCDIMREAYPELRERREQVALIIRSEEERFLRTLDQGMAVFDQLVSQLKDRRESVISGEELFRLYDTYGIPLDLAEDMAREEEISIDREGFQVAMEHQRQRARAATQFQALSTDEWEEALGESEARFVGYDSHRIETRIARYRHERDRLAIVLENTPFYAEEGGQLSDTGRIYNASMEVIVEDVQRSQWGPVHYGRLVRGQMSGEPVIAEIDLERRLNLARHHTATHLLQAALRQVLGDHVRQEGSLVAPDHFRFDFSHFAPVSPRELALIEELVNQKIWENQPVVVQHKDYHDAVDQGAIALFGEKYEEKVRVIQIGDFSMELCGGTHLKATGEIGLFKVISESAVAAGIRRIEACTGPAAYNHILHEEEILQGLSAAVNVGVEDLVDRVERLMEDRKRLEHKVAEMEQRLGSSLVARLVEEGREVDGVTVVASRVGLDTVEGLRTMADQLRSFMKTEGAGVLASQIDDKAVFVAFVTDDLIPRVKASDIARRVAKIAGGGGGGKPHLAEAGGKDVHKLNDAIAAVAGVVRDLLLQ
jgi:alanyl-tRNA synthetase